jgi:predicted  nucleic acid-binding Zn-ribbon protein
MPISRALYELQQLDTQLAHIRRERSHLDDGETLRAEASTLQKAIAAEEEKLNQCTRARVEKEDELKQREEKLRTQQTRLMNAKTAHEIASLQRDIDSITRSRGELDEAILVAMDECEGCAATLDELRRQLEAVNTRLAEVESQFAADAAHLDAQLKQVLAQREDAAKLLGEEETEHYEQSAKKHGGIAVTWNDKSNCAACGMTLTPYNLKAAKAEEWPVCESCGRLLFAEAV